MHPAIFLLEQWRHFMNGVDRVMCFYEQGVTPLEGLEWNRQMHGISTPLTIADEVQEKLVSIIKEKTAYQWLRPDLLPFINQSQVSLNQLDLFSESLYLVLLIRTNHHSIKLISYLFFRNDCSNFGISDGRTQLETSHKAIIGKMASQFASLTLNNFFKAKEETSAFKQQTKILLEARQLESNRGKEELDAWKNNWLDTYLIERSQRDGFNYVISSAAKEKLLTAGLNYEQSKGIIDNCIVYICNLNEFVTGDEVLIDASYLVITTPREPMHTTASVQPVQGTNKTILLLNRLEEAALQLYKQGLPITSADVGASLSKPISAPAISDALRKNRVRILQLFEQYPQRWMTIRQSFKPIINLKTKKSSFLNASG